MKKYNCLVCFFSLLFLLSCAKEESFSNSVPNVRVEIDINTIIDHEFNTGFHRKKFYADNGTYTYAGYVGVLAISNAEGTNIYAYDLCCPNEAPAKVELQDATSVLKLKCPRCHSEFNVGNGSGRVEAGPSKEALKRYQVLRDGAFYRIRN